MESSHRAGTADRGLPRFGIARVRGVSMQPTLHDGDNVLVDYRMMPEVGHLTVLRFHDGEVSVKRVDLIDGGGFWVSRDNPRAGRDSWTLGGIAIPPSDIVGVVRARLWPWPRLLGTKGKPARNIRQ